jgi:hypothetical protein
MPMIKARAVWSQCLSAVRFAAVSTWHWDLVGRTSVEYHWWAWNTAWCALLIDSAQVNEATTAWSALSLF